MHIPSVTTHYLDLMYGERDGSLDLSLGTSPHLMAGVGVEGAGVEVGRIGVGKVGARVQSAK